MPEPVRMPWPFGEPGDPSSGIPNVPSSEGELAGAELARRTVFLPGVDPCHDCAFVKGTVPNRCLPTVVDALECVVGGEPFYCHHHAADGGGPAPPCAGWVAARWEIERGEREDP